MKITALSVEETDQGCQKLCPVYDDWEDLKNKYNRESPTGINNAFQTAASQWGRLATEQEITRGAIQGIILSLVFAFIVMLVSTMNVLSAFYAI
jgi:hypothetical protein